LAPLAVKSLENDAGADPGPGPGGEAVSVLPPVEGGNVPIIGAGRSDSSGIETEADPGGITSRFVGLRPTGPLAAGDSAAACWRIAAAGNRARGRNGGSVDFFTRPPAAGPKLVGCWVFAFPPPCCGAQSAGLPRSRFGGPLGGGPWEADGLDWFSGELMRPFLVWPGSLEDKKSSPQAADLAWPGSPSPCISLSYQ
jgi:hypothetical protein